VIFNRASTAKAMDDKGAVTTSAARSITVTAALPTISLTSPPDNQMQPRRRRMPMWSDRKDKLPATQRKVTRNAPLRIYAPIRQTIKHDHQLRFEP
jgi:hypothetical protein